MLDVNDNSPTFLQSPYRFSLDETVAVGEVVFTKVTVADADAGLNAIVKLTCVEEDNGQQGNAATAVAGDACETFEIRAQELSSGSYVGLISLKKPLDYEARSSYNFVIKAEDGSLEESKSSTTNVLIEVNDVQDQAPFFVNAPYSATVLENTPSVSINSFRRQDL